MRYTCQINMMARANLIAPGTVFDMFIATGGSKDQWQSTPIGTGDPTSSYESVGYTTLAERGYASWSEEDDNFPKAIASRGVTKETLPIDYPYRDDGRLVWDALHGFIKDMLRLHYRTDSDVASDPHLQAFVQDLMYAYGYADAVGMGFTGHGFSTFDGLCERLTSMLWGAGYQHSAVNYQQYQYFGYVPNMPLAMMKPVPQRGQGPKSMQDLLDYLPDGILAVNQISITYLLSTFEEDQQFLSDVQRAYGPWFQTQEEQQVLERFECALTRIEELVNQRNHHRPVYYQAFLPSRCPISITI